jgi:hypothetical protein
MIQSKCNRFRSLNFILTGVADSEVLVLTDLLSDTNGRGSRWSWIQGRERDGVTNLAAIRVSAISFFLADRVVDS